MTDPYGPTTRNFDTNKPEDLAHLVRTKVFWTTAGPQTMQKACEAIARGDAPFVPAVVPPEAVRYIDHIRNQLGKPPLGEPTVQQTAPVQTTTAPGAPVETPTPPAAAPDTESPAEDKTEPTEEPTNAPPTA